MTALICKILGHKWYDKNKTVKEYCLRCGITKEDIKKYNKKHMIKINGKYYKQR